MKYKRRTSYNIEDDFLNNLLIDRNILEKSEPNDWFYAPTFDNECDPLLLDNMEKGYKLFLKHLNNGSHIRLYVDCD